MQGSTEYSTPIDMWGVGCIFYEMASGRPLFPGSTVEDELHLIFKVTNKDDLHFSWTCNNTRNFLKVLGTPTEENWPGISMSEEYASHNFLHYSPELLVKRAPRLDPDGLDLVSKFLLYEARKRISAKDAMRHPYFDSLGPGVHNLLDGEKIYKLFKKCGFLINCHFSSICVLRSWHSPLERSWLQIIDLSTELWKISSTEHATLDYGQSWRCNFWIWFFKWSSSMT